jgi:LuxR family maltose regulon positive regulatory protein
MTSIDDRSDQPTVRLTLLHRPPAPPGAIARRELVEALDAGLGGAATLVSAPAGYGKSVLASQWCEHLDRRVAWLSLAAPANGLRGFLGYLAAAIRSACPDSLAATARLVGDGTEPAEDVALTALSNDLSELDEPIVVVLDDYHALDSRAVHDLMTGLLRHPAPAVHFMTLTRRDPPWPIASLRAAGRLHELRMEDLRFTADESARLVGSELRRQLDDREKAALDESTEGWAAGLRLAVHALRYGASAESVFGAGYLDRGTQEYLTGEVLERLPPEVLPAMAVASYFDRFNAELFDAVLTGGKPTPTITGHEFISWLQRENLFAIPLDDRGGWFRFHHVFGRLLGEWRKANATRFRLEEGDLHRTAARLSLERGDIDEAIRELALAGDGDAAVELVWTRGMVLVDEDRWGELASLLDAVPDELSERHAVIFVLRAWLAGEHGGRYREMLELFDRAETLLDERPHGPSNDDDLRGQIVVLRGTYARLNAGDFAGGLDDARVALELLSGAPGRVLTHAYALGAVALANSGQYRDARRFLDAAMDDERFAGLPIDPASWARPLTAWVDGSLDAVDRAGSRMLAIGERYGLRAFTVYGHYFRGVCAYERNDLAAARDHLTVAIDLDFAIVEVLVHSKIALALADLAMGRPLDALRECETMLHAMHDTRGDYTKPTAEAAMALVEFRTGREAAALRWAQAAESDLPRHRYMFFDREPALLEILLSSESDRDRGRKLLDHALASPYGQHNRPVSIKLHTLSALDAARDGDSDRALGQLAVAVSHAREGGHIRSIADFGPELVPLLHRLDAVGADLEHVGAILGAIGSRRGADGSNGVVRVVVSGSVGGEPGLTDREVDVLRLLALRYTNKEISRELMIAPATVKKHTVTLYDKLHVHGRREAVEKARALGYINE